MALTQRESVLQMLAQLATLDPSVSAELGTPERKILDTVAQQIADSSADLAVLAGSLDIDSKFGTSLDRFVAIFNFERQKAAAATGFVTFSRVSPSTQDIPIPQGTQLAARSLTTNGDLIDAFFRTTFQVTLSAGETQVVAPVVAVIPGTLGNVAANTIVDFVTPVLGVTGVTNETPTSGGADAESDDALKVRFTNTVFRNVAGTEDQYLGLAVSTLSTKANVVGPISRYREYLQVPSADDATGGNGSAGNYTSALSTIPYSKHVYDTVPFFVSNGQQGALSLFYRLDTDFILNTGVRNLGDTYRLFNASQGPDPADEPFEPNLTFKNVYTGTDATVTALRPSDIVLFEHSYMSAASRNDFERSVFNAVDIYVEGQGDVTADCVLVAPSVGNIFVDDPTHAYYYENYRRVGEPEHRPVIGNAIQPLFEQPVTELPVSLTIDGCNYDLGTHYWLVEDVSELGGTVRARNAIEWAKYLAGTGGSAIPALQQTAPYPVSGYKFDRDISDLQTAVEAAKQVGADVLVHRSRRRYFKLDVTVMYSVGHPISAVNDGVRTAVDAFFASAFFGAAIQLSDLLQVVHNTPGVDNVRWSRDLPPVTPGGSEIDSIYNRVVECDINGKPLLNVIVERIRAGGTVATEQQIIVLTGSPSGASTYKLTYNTTVTAALAYSASAATVQTALRTATGDTGLLVSGNGTSANPFVVSWSVTGVRPLLTAQPTFVEGPSILNSDFFLQDDELPALPTAAVTGDSVAGLIIRPRAQSTWSKG